MPAEDHDTAAAGVGYVGREVVSVGVCSGSNIATPIASADSTVPTLRNLNAGGSLKGYSARESDVSGGETGKNTDKIPT